MGLLIEDRKIEPFMPYRAIEPFQWGVLVRLAELDISQLYLPGLQQHVQ
jgi:hypothetical protein